MTTIIKGNWRDKIDEVMAAQHTPFVFIVSSHAGTEPGDVDVLLSALDRYTLDPTFEGYGNFATMNPCQGVHNPEWNYTNNEPKWIDGPRLFDVDGVVSFFGNFLDYSHGFSIYTNDQTTIELLTTAILRNQQRETYRLAKSKPDAIKATKWREL